MTDDTKDPNLDASPETMAGTVKSIEDDRTALPEPSATRSPEIPPEAMLETPDHQDASSVDHLGFRRDIGSSTSRGDSPTHIDSLDPVSSDGKATEVEMRTLDDDRVHQVQQHLDDAINSLEMLLNQRQHQREHANLSPNVDGQYTIPLLDEVVVPSPDGELASPITTPEWDANAEKVARFQPILDRLASELEVIVQTGVDEALKNANQKILQRVRNHIAIVLPEILEELEHEQERDP